MLKKHPPLYVRCHIKRGLSCHTKSTTWGGGEHYFFRKAGGRPQGAPPSATQCLGAEKGSRMSKKSTNRRRFTEMKVVLESLRH